MFIDEKKEDTIEGKFCMGGCNQGCIQYSENGRDERAKFEQLKGKIRVPGRAIDL